MSQTTDSIVRAGATVLWERYLAGGGIVVRNQLVEAYMPMVRAMAAKLRARLPPMVEFDDLVTAGVFGLMQAIERFESARGVKFQTYATPRVHGAMLDELRKADHVSRHSRLKVAAEDLPRLTSLNELIGGKDDYKSSDTFAGEVPDREDWMAELETGDLVTRLYAFMRPVERTIVTMYYREHRTMREVAAAMGLSESRVSQLLGKLLRKLATVLAHRKSEFCLG